MLGIAGAACASAAILAAEPAEDFEVHPFANGEAQARFHREVLPLGCAVYEAVAGDHLPETLLWWTRSKPAYCELRVAGGKPRLTPFASLSLRAQAGAERAADPDWQKLQRATQRLAVYRLVNPNL